MGVYITPLPSATAAPGYSCTEKIVFLLILPGEIRVRSVYKRLSLFPRFSVVSPCVRWLYCCNPPNPIVVSAPHVHTCIYRQCGAVTWSTVEILPLIQPGKHSSDTRKETCVHTIKHGRAPMPDTGQQFILSPSSPVSEADCSESESWTYVVFLCRLSFQLFTRSRLRGLESTLSEDG